MNWFIGGDYDSMITAGPELRDPDSACEICGEGIYWEDRDQPETRCDKCRDFLCEDCQEELTEDDWERGEVLCEACRMDEIDPDECAEYYADNFDHVATQSQLCRKE